MLVANFVIIDAILLTSILKDQLKTRLIRVGNPNLHLNTPEKGFICQAVRINIGTKNDQRTEWNDDSLTSAQP